MDDHPVKRPPTLEKLKFERRPMVRWLDPLELIQTGLRTAISTIFGEFADKRELQEALVHDVAESYPNYGTGDLWLDFVADSGDGFESTYTVAYLLAQAELVLGDTGAQRLPRGNLLVLGGDQVYPTPSRRGYENRLLGPYEAALPAADSQPDLYAIPGNHDWYDGLTNFLRFFCNDQSIGGWKTRQRRSYFAVKLTHNWWLWGIDIQFDAYIDEPQLRYFDRAALEFKGGERVLLATGKPSWTDVKPKSPSYENLRYLEERIIESGGRVERVERPDPPRPAPTVPVMLTGDDHHYARYESDDGLRHKLTAGGGGAFLSATHHLRESVPLTRGYDDETEDTDYHLRMRYPSSGQSRRMAPAALWLLPWRNRRFIGAVFFAYLVPALLLQVPTSALAEERSSGFLDFLGATAWSEWTAYAGAVLFLFLVVYAAVERLYRRALVAAAHALAHVMLLAVFVAVAARICHALAWWVETGRWRNIVFEGDVTVAILGAALAMVPGTILVAAYLVGTDLISRNGRAFARHTTELFAAQQRTGYKNFLRIHISHETGAMTIYPICVPRAAEFEFRTGGTGNEPFFKPTTPIEWGLIEQPIVVGGEPRALETLSGQSVS